MSPRSPELVAVHAGADGEKAERVVLDYISSMTDRYAITKYEEIYVPKSWHII